MRSPLYTPPQTTLSTPLLTVSMGRVQGSTSKIARHSKAFAPHPFHHFSPDYLYIWLFWLFSCFRFRSAAPSALIMFCHSEKERSPTRASRTLASLASDSLACV